MMSYTDLSCMGSKYYETPNIDQIARSEMVFTNGYADCQVCNHSESCILTGKCPAILNYRLDWRRFGQRLAKNEPKSNIGIEKSR